MPLSLSLLFPPRCLICGADIESEADILCEKCRILWKLERQKRCPVCGCGVEYCRCVPPALSCSAIGGVTSAVFYTKRQSTARSLLLFAKQRCSGRLAAFFASELAEILTERSFFTQNTVLTYVPRSPSKKREYGFDQAELIAKALAPLLGLPLVRPLKHIGNTEQKLLGGAERRANAADSYCLKRNFTFRGENVLLIDDIITTGASMEVCAELLWQAGSGMIFCASVGRTKEG